MRVRWRLLGYVAGLCTILLLVPITVWAASQTVQLAPSDAVTVRCDTELVGTVGGKEATIACATPTTGQTIAGTPVCTDHDATKWHGLVKRNPDNSMACTYGHEHKDDPRALDGLFGPLQQEISYPWQTSSALGQENDAKHRVYNWLTIREQDLGGRCLPSGGGSKGVMNARAQTHADGNGGATTRYHSFLVQAQLCDTQAPGYRGKITLGGHLDFGNLQVLTDRGEERVRLPGDAPDATPRRRTHGSPGRARSDFTWYGGNQAERTGAPSINVDFGFRKEDWGPVDPNVPSSVYYYGGAQNGSWIALDFLNFYVDPLLDTLDGTADGLVSLAGYTDRHGNIRTDCSAPATNCVPFRLENVRPGLYQFRGDVAGLGARDYDVLGQAGQSLIQYPN